MICDSFKYVYGTIIIDKLIFFYLCTIHIEPYQLVACYLKISDNNYKRNYIYLFIIRYLSIFKLASNPYSSYVSFRLFLSRY